jgi:hypothetical protein
MNAPSSKRPRGVKGTKSPRRRSAEASLKKGSPAGVGDDTSRGAFPIVGIGASAGGLEAFTELLKALPDDTGMSFVLVQHLDPERESQLSQILARATLLPVHEIAGEERVRPNHVYIISPNTELTLVKGVLKAQSRERTRTPHRPIDSFFESLAQDQRERAVGVVLSGTATDGTLGLEAIKAEGGLTFAQDASAKYDSRSTRTWSARRSRRSPSAHAPCPERRCRPAARLRRSGHRRAPMMALKRSRTAMERTAGPTTERSCCSCATTPAWTSRSTNQPPCSGGSTGAWC